jgi:hypothetical protein
VLAVAAGLAWYKHRQGVHKPAAAAYMGGGMPAPQPMMQAQMAMYPAGVVAAPAPAPAWAPPLYRVGEATPSGGARPLAGGNGGAAPAQPAGAVYYMGGATNC